ncbi:sigma-70 family RNA polymerase sigma factor [uncultured Duncaniella sp.]|uniref:sigma-70 family RNA polymerase sigma factor n=1 Tax=uncultured Duncaniella sp. TaxID=2768039 RepID=UPI0026EA211C|nr:sigma-70 family RNA polymerase sigma factor [uncultured Duncaniella sp.]
MTTTDDIEKLFRTNYKAALIFANRLVHDDEAARDIVHDVFASLLLGDVRFVSPAYLIKGVRYACLKHIRNTSVRERIKMMYAIDLQEIEDEEWPDDEDIAKLNMIIDRLLPVQTQKIVRLRFESKMTYKEIAEEISVSEVSVYKHLSRAMNVLRQNFNKHER